MSYICTACWPQTLSYIVSSCAQPCEFRGVGDGRGAGAVTLTYSLGRQFLRLMKVLADLT